MQKQTQRHRLCTLAKRMTSILRHVAEVLPPARQGTILNSHRVISIATNTSMVLNCAFVTYIMMTAYAGLPGAVYRHMSRLNLNVKIRSNLNEKCPWHNTN